MPLADGGARTSGGRAGVDVSLGAGAGARCAGARLALPASAQAIRNLAPGFVIVATGAQAACVSVRYVAALDAAVTIVARVGHSARAGIESRRVPSFTIIGGGMVGIETADLLVRSGVSCTVIEALSSLAPGMARNNRMELLDRVTVTRRTASCSTARSSAATGADLDVRTEEGATQRSRLRRLPRRCHRAAPERGAVAAIQAAASLYALAAIAYRPGDFLSCLRDAWIGAQRGRSISAAGIGHRAQMPTHVIAAESVSRAING